MQKRAYQERKTEYITVDEPLPVAKDAPVYRDARQVHLPHAESFPKLHFHDRFEIGVCESGEGLFLSEGEFFSLSAGDAVLVPPGKRHYSRSIDPDALCFCRFAYVLPEVLRAALSPFCDDVDRLLAESNAFPTVLRGEEAREIHAAFRDTGAGADAATVLHLAVLLLTLPRTQATPPQAAPSGRAESELAQYLSLHYAENESIGTLAAKHHMSESQLRRKFVAAYGMPPIAYRNRLRCKIGEELLLRTDIPIGAISERLGFSSPTEFYRVFQRYHGVSPSQFRRK
jgi:AraC-like DNA-binding protein/quercetin dioxygenase-like cupin family protein